MSVIEMPESECEHYIALETSFLHEIDADTRCGYEVAEQWRPGDGVEAISGRDMHEAQCRAWMETCAEYGLYGKETITCAERFMNADGSTQKLYELVTVAEEKVAVECRHIGAGEIKTCAEFETDHNGAEVFRQFGRFDGSGAFAAEREYIGIGLHYDFPGGGDGIGRDGAVGQIARDDDFLHGRLLPGG